MVLLLQLPARLRLRLLSVVRKLARLVRPLLVLLHVVQLAERHVAQLVRLLVALLAEQLVPQRVAQLVPQRVAQLVKLLLAHRKPDGAFLRVRPLGQSS